MATTCKMAFGPNPWRHTLSPHGLRSGSSRVSCQLARRGSATLGRVRVCVGANLPRQCATQTFGGSMHPEDRMPLDGWRVFAHASMASHHHGGHLKLPSGTTEKQIAEAREASPSPTDHTGAACASRNTVGHCRSRLEQILNPVIHGGLAANLTRWETQVKEYESDHTDNRR